MTLGSCVRDVSRSDALGITVQLFAKIKRKMSCKTGFVAFPLCKLYYIKPVPLGTFFWGGAVPLGWKDGSGVKDACFSSSSVTRPISRWLPAACSSDGLFWIP